LISVQQLVGHPHRRPCCHNEIIQSYDDRGSFTSYTLRGYDTLDPELYIDRSAPFCDALNLGFEIGVQTSWHMEDDLWQIAGSLSHHPMIKYHSEQVEGRFDLQTLVEDSWARLATACVLLPKDNIYLCITRIVFHAEATRDHGRASFIRGQLYNKHWIHLDNYQLRWGSQTITFPRILDVPFDFDREGLWYGPEDARIVIEHGVEDSEPVIVFNMIGSKSDWNRGMWILRPFSLHMVLLTIRASDRAGAEKNWTPFFFHESSDIRPAQSVRSPSTYIHFVRSFGPLEVLKCSLIDGICDSVFLQNTVKEPEDSKNGYSYLRGGTQFRPIPLGVLAGQAPAIGIYDYQGLQAYIALPRTNTGDTKYCQEPFYRPHLAIMITDGTNFAMTYGSEPIDFGPNKVVDQASLDEPCGTGRIMIPNGIADWDYAATTREGKTDIMTIQVSVNDATVQNLRLSGILDLIRNLHSIRRMLRDPTTYFNTSTSNSGLYSEVSNQISPSTQGIRKCMEDAARQYIEDHTSSELKKIIDLAEKEKTEVGYHEQQLEDEDSEERPEEEEGNGNGERYDQVGDGENNEESDGGNRTQDSD
jgi:beta-1,2-mannosyltransferase